MRRGVVGFGLGLYEVFGLHTRGPAAVFAQCPVANIVVMTDPIHELAAAVGQMPTPVSVMPAEGVLEHWRRAGP